MPHTCRGADNRIRKEISFGVDDSKKKEMRTKGNLNLGNIWT